jgi:putative endopeptidase
MKKLLILLALGVNAFLPFSSLATEPAPPEPPRFKIEHLDRTADPKSDFAQYAFGNWLKNNPIPPDKSRWGGFGELAQFNWAALKNILEQAAAGPREPGSLNQKVGDFFASAMNTTAIDAAGLTPLSGDLALIFSIATADDLARAVAKLHNQGFSGLFRVSVYADQKQSDLNALYIWQGGFSLPSKEYYFAETFAKQRAAFIEHVTKMLMLAGSSQEDAAADAQTVFALEKALAAQAKTPVELRDTLSNYNKKPTADFAVTLAAFPLARYLDERGLTGAGSLIIGQPAFFTGLQEQLSQHPLSAWKTYLRYHTLASAADALAAPFEQEVFRFYSTVLRGTPEMEPRWQRAARTVDSLLGEALGRLYVERYYPPQARARMDDMIRNIRAVMRERLQKADWMTQPTREKALTKFDRFVARIGHPDTWRDYSAVTISPSGYFENVRAATRAEIARKLSKLGQPVDKAEWSMSPPTVNAYFQPTANQIVFPAGILQPPFFDFTLDDAINYGAIGAVIGHEITHGFDDQGRRYDAEGNLSDWWTLDDAAQFQARAVKVIQQYNTYAALPGLHINGALSLGENIADLGGVSIAFEAFQRSIAGKERPLIDGFTPEQRFFLSWAQQWRTHFREDDLRRQVAVGPHSPGQFRAIGPLVNMQEFFDAFGIKEGDALWRKPEDRAKIW